MSKLAPIAGFVARRPLDPRIVNVLFDADAFDRQGELRDQVARLLALREAGKIKLVAPAGVREQIHHPNTPPAVRKAASIQIHTLPVELNDGESRELAAITMTMRGNSTSDKHDADARHLFEAGKYGGYFITHDRRINAAKRRELEAVLPPSLWIVTLAEFFVIYDDYEAGRLI